MYRQISSLQKLVGQLLTWVLTQIGTRSPQPSQYPIGLTNAQEYKTLIENWSNTHKVDVYSMFEIGTGVNTSSQYNIMLETKKYQTKNYFFLFILKG